MSISADEYAYEEGIVLGRYLNHSVEHANLSAQFLSHKTKDGKLIAMVVFVALRDIAVIKQLFIN
jgi:SET domain-containing protein